MNIEGFRSLNQDINTIINKSEAIKKAKKEAAEQGKEFTDKEKKEMSDEEKEYKTKRKQIQEKLIKFATRVPIFMYLTDFREYSLKDVITQFEPGLFKKVTGLSVKDFELLVSLGLFNDELMNDAVYNFKRYEDSSLEYAGIKMHADDEDVGLFSTVISKEDYEQMAKQQGSSMVAPAPMQAAKVVEPFKVISGGADKPKTKPESNKPTASYTIPISNAKVAEPVSKNDKPEVPVVKKGDIIEHKKFGRGTVISVGDDKFTAQFEFGLKALSTSIVFTNGIVTLIGGE